MGCAGSQDAAQQPRPGKTAPSGFNRERPSIKRAPEQEAAAAPEDAAPVDAVDIDDFNKIQLDAHNEHRANHGAPAVVWDADLAKQA